MVDVKHADAIRRYRRAHIEWDIASAKVLAGCETEDRRQQVYSQFIIDNEDQYREMQELRLELHLVELEDAEHLRFVEAHERLAAAEERIATAEEQLATTATTEGTGEQVVTKA